MPRPNKPNTVSMRTSLRCGAKTRRGAPCQAPAVRGKKRCRMHGGAKGSGAPKGNQNAYKHGPYSATSIEMQRYIRGIVKRSKELFEKV